MVSNLILDFDKNNMGIIVYFFEKTYFHLLLSQLDHFGFCQIFLIQFHH